MSATIHPENRASRAFGPWGRLGRKRIRTSIGRAACLHYDVDAVADEADDPSDVWSVMAALMPEHPKPRYRDPVPAVGGQGVVGAGVLAMLEPFGHRRQICCEQIENQRFRRQPVRSSGGDRAARCV